MNINSFISKINALESKANNLLNLIVLENSKEFEEANRKSLSQGKDSENKNVRYKPSRKTPAGKAYSKGYEKKRLKAGKQISVADLNFTGKYYKDLSLQQKGKNIYEITNNNEVDPFLTKNYGNDIKGVSQKKVDEIVRKQIIPQLQTLITIEIG